jgi:hypothetical protein
MESIIVNLVLAGVNFYLAHHAKQNDSRGVTINYIVGGFNLGLAAASIIHYIISN